MEIKNDTNYNDSEVKVKLALPQSNMEVHALLHAPHCRIERME